MSEEKQFLVLGYDSKDEEAFNRRLAMREAHIALASKHKDSGNLLYAAAILDEQGEMCGSIMVTDFDSRDKLEDWLRVEPYVTGKVWEKIKVIPCKVGPMFALGS